MQNSISLLLASFLGVSAVALGAMGAHGLKAQLEAREMLSAWQTGALYHSLHALACLSAALAQTLLSRAHPLRPWLSRAQVTWAVGALLFSGSLYFLSLGGPRWLGPVTPVGGVFLMTGWVMIGLGAKAAGKTKVE